MDNFKKCNIGISGVAGSGKDTLAAMILSGLSVTGFDYRQYSFARPLKTFSKGVFWFDDYDVYDQDGKEQKFDIRFNKAAMKKRFDANLEMLLEHTDIIPNEQDWDHFLEVMFDQIQPRGIIEAAKEWISPEQKSLRFQSTPRIILQLLGTEFFRDRISESFWTDIAPKNQVVISDMRFMNELEFVEGLGGITIGITGRNENSLVPVHTSESVGPVIQQCKYVFSNTSTLEAMQDWVDAFLDAEFLGVLQ